MTRSDADLDVVLFGATGIAGGFVAEHLTRYAGDEAQPPRIGLAGRDAAAVTAVRDGLGRRAAGWEVLVVDAASVPDVERLARRARVVVSTVGPYDRFGAALVRACAAAGTHYADLSGEALFIRESVVRCHDTAAANGACLVHAAGFDSVPSDLAVRLLAQAAASDGAGELAETTGYWRILRGGVGRGTLTSMNGQVDRVLDDPAARAVVADPYALSPDRRAEPEPLDAPAPVGHVGPRRDPDLPGWVAPFVMGGINGQIVRRTNALSGWSYGRGFRYREVVDAGRANTAPVKAAAWAALVPLTALARSTRPGRRVVDRVVRALPDGPDRLRRERGRFRLEARARTTSGAAYVATVEAQADPAFAGTAVMLGETALALAAAPPGSLPGGVRTPADALGDELVRRLRTRCFRLVARRA